LDVVDRLAEGRPAVEHTQSYVQACHALGYGHPDLTSHPFQVRDWYASEDGLDLRALDRDCGQLRAAASAVTEALRMQRAQVAELAAAWIGPGGDAAVRFLERHCDSGAMVATELRAAAQRCESLRDNLWYLVDSKVATAIAVDERTRPQRQEWLAAAAALTTGAGDRATAEAVVHDQIAPYVEEDIRNDWLTTMRSTVAGVTTSYDMVIDRMAGAPAPSFEFPGDLRLGGPPLSPPSAPTAAAGLTPAATYPSPADPAPPPGAGAAAPAPPAAAPPPPAAAPAAPAPDWGPALGNALGTPAGDPGGGLGSLGGLAGLAGRIVDAMGGLLGSTDDQVGSGDPLGEDAFDDQDPFHPDEEKDADETREADEKKEPDTVAEAQRAGTPPAPDTAPPPTDSAAPAAVPAPVAAPGPSPDATPTPTPVAAPPAGGPAPPGKEGSTPCEIAADQLPQAGQ